MGFEPTTPISQGKRLAGARTRPLCDPSLYKHQFYYITRLYFAQIPACVIIIAVEINVLLEERVGEGLDADWAKSIAEKALLAQNVDSRAELSLVIVSQERIQELNQRYLGRDRPTDVIAFSLLPQPSSEEFPPFVAPPDDVLHLGEVIISYPQAVLQAEEQGHSAKKELAILIIHGILHLFGYEDEKPGAKRRMRAREKEILGLIEGGLD